MSALSEALAVYRNPRLLAILAMGFASGLPLALTGATLQVWLTESSVSLKSIGFFAAVGTFYTLKFLWSPVLDRVAVPWLSRWLGQRRAWLIVIAALLACGDRPAGLHRSDGRSVVHRAVGRRRRLPLGQPGHRDRRVPDRAPARRRADRGRCGHPVGLPLRHDRVVRGRARAGERVWLAAELPRDGGTGRCRGRGRAGFARAEPPHVTAQLPARRGRGAVPRLRHAAAAGCSSSCSSCSTASATRSSARWPPRST